MGRQAGLDVDGMWMGMGVCWCEDGRMQSERRKSSR